MRTVDHTLIHRRLEELLEQSLELAAAADAEIMVYLFEMAKLELQTLRSGEDRDRAGPVVKITQRR